MSVETIAAHIQSFASCAEAAPWLILFFIFFFMAVESSFIPFPSEVVMIPAGFLLYRFPLPTGIIWLDFLIVVLTGVAGSLAGAFINYGLAVWLGRPFLYRYGKYFFLKEASLERAEEIFRKYGDMVTFVCRLLPAIRQLVSIPAGLARMKLGRFTFFTGLGAGIWSAILAAVGLFFGYSAGDMSYLEMVQKGKQLIHEHYIWIIVLIVLVLAVHWSVQHLIMHKSESKTESDTTEG